MFRLLIMVYKEYFNIEYLTNYIHNKFVLCLCLYVYHIFVYENRIHLVTRLLYLSCRYDENLQIIR